MKTAAGNGNKPEYAEVAVVAITPSPTNPRKWFDKTLLDELSASVKEKGVLEPLLVRRRPGKKIMDDFEIIAGERRWKAAKLAGLSTVPVMIRDMTDEEVLDVQIIENLQRADLHELDEAQGYAHLLKAVPGLTIVELARRVAKPESYITRRLALNRLIPAAQDDFRKGIIQIGHALELCRLTPDVQKHAHVECFHTEWKGNANKRTPVRDKPQTVRHLQSWIQENLLLDLSKAPFKLDDATLVPKAGPCMTCPKRTGCSPALFADIKKGDLCSDPLCYDAKAKAMLERNVKEVKERTKQKSVPGITLQTGFVRDLPEGTLRRSEYGQSQFVLVDKKTRCVHAVEAVVNHGQSFGQSRLICTEPKCKDHLGRVGSTSRNSSSGERVEKTPAEKKKFNERKQELFDCRIAEPVRRRTLRSVLQHIILPEIPKEHESLWDSFQMIALEHFNRIPSFTQRVMLEVLEWDDVAKSIKQYNGADEDLVKARLIKMSPTEVFAFMTLCSIAHYGENEGMYGWHEQFELVQVAEAYGVPYKLFDARQRISQNPAKKYMTSHSLYLLELLAGRDVKRPDVYISGVTDNAYAKELEIEQQVKDHVTSTPWLDGPEGVSFVGATVLVTHGPHKGEGGELLETANVSPGITCTVKIGRQTVKVLAKDLIYEFGVAAEALKRIKKLKAKSATTKKPAAKKLVARKTAKKKR